MSPQPNAQISGKPSTDELIASYSVEEPVFIQQDRSAPASKATFAEDPPTGIWSRKTETAKGEASIVCTGSLLYSDSMERNAHLGRSYQFQAPFKHARDFLDDADLTVGSLGTMVADMYPPQTLMSEGLTEGHYANARPEYLEALKFAGFDCLALANPYNLDGGVRGVAATETAVSENAMVPSGLGSAKNPIFDVNGIKVAVLSFTMEMHNKGSRITDEGAEQLLNISAPDKTRAIIEQSRAAGAQFVLCYLDCRSDDGNYKLPQRQQAAEQIADGGADYVVCTTPLVLSKYYLHTAADRRSVPIATGLGAFMSSSQSEGSRLSAALKITVRLKDDASIEIEDRYVPFRRFKYYQGAVNPIVPGMRLYNHLYKRETFDDPNAEIARRLGDRISIEEKRKVWISTHFRPQLSPSDMSKILNVPFSQSALEQLGDALHRRVRRIVPRKGDLRRGCAAVVARHNNYQSALNQMTYGDAIAAGATMVVGTEPDPRIPTLVVDDVWAAYAKLTTAVRELYRPTTVAITGTAGKTTSKELMKEVFDRHCKTLTIEANNNTLMTVGLVVQKLTEHDEAFIQEVHGGHPGAARSVSKLIKPDICLITNIGYGHLGQMGTIENIVKGKMQVTEGMHDDGVLIINNDNEHLREQHPACRTIRYSIEDEACEYHARNIRDSGEALEFELVSPDGTFNIMLNFQGRHNVGNAVGVFAAAREAGIPPYRIIAGLSRYVPNSVRQNLVEVGGYKLLIDVYSSTPESVLSATETLCSIPVTDGGRRIAIVGDIPDQGAKTEQNHLDVGRRLGTMNFDVLLCCGEDSQHIVEAAREQGKEAHYFADRAEFNRHIASIARPGDALLFKGGTRVRLLEETLRPLFGEIV